MDRLGILRKITDGWVVVEILQLMLLIVGVLIVTATQLIVVIELVKQVQGYMGILDNHLKLMVMLLVELGVLLGIKFKNLLLHQQQMLRVLEL